MQPFLIRVAEDIFEVPMIPIYQVLTIQVHCVSSYLEHRYIFFVVVVSCAQQPAGFDLYLLLNMVNSCSEVINQAVTGGARLHPGVSSCAVAQLLLHRKLLTLFLCHACGSAVKYPQRVCLFLSVCGPSHKEVLYRQREWPYMDAKCSAGGMEWKLKRHPHFFHVSGDPKLFLHFNVTEGVFCFVSSLLLVLLFNSSMTTSWACFCQALININKHASFPFEFISVIVLFCSPRHSHSTDHNTCLYSASPHMIQHVQFCRFGVPI